MRLLPFVLVLSSWAEVQGAVRLNEIHYDPLEGPGHEFIELYNAGDESVPLASWGLSSGVHYLIGPGISIAPHGFLVIAKDRDLLIAYYRLDPEKVLGPLEGALDNGGERIDLSNALGVVVDSVAYDDDPPWDSRAAGQGASLQRICATYESDTPTNWTAESVPSPLAETASRRCPPPDLPAAKIAINELHYHASNSNDEHEEFVELRNNSATTIHLKDYSFSSGIEFTFTQDFVLAPGDVVAVCRDAEYVRTTFGTTKVVGNFAGQLSNDGERVTLVDPTGAVADSVPYQDNGSWPVVADGLGSSLEKVRPDAPSEDPMSWAASDSLATRNRQHVVVRGKATSTLLTLRLDQTGECLFDNISLVDVQNPARNLIPNGSFDRDLSSISFEGSHFASSWDPNGGTNGTGALRLRATLIGGGGKPFFQQGGPLIRPADFAANRAWFDLQGLVSVNGPTYELSFDFTYLSGWRGITVAFDQSSAEQGIYWRLGPLPSATPGRPNSIVAEQLPPQITEVARSIREPKSTDTVSLRARVRSGAGTQIAKVQWVYWLDLKGEATTVDGFDDGVHGDADAGDGIFAAALPQFPHNTVVTFRVRAEDNLGNVTWAPLDSDPTGVEGFYVNDLQPASKLPIYQILLQHKSRSKPRPIIAQLDCQHYWTGAFAYEGDVFSRVGIRMRGASVCMTPKPYLKVRFLRGREFQKQHKLNFQALWTDKSLIRERLAYDVFTDLGYPSSRHDFVRVHANGVYYGLFATAENVDDNLLARHGLDSSGNVYKSVSSSEEPNGGDPGPWEKKTNKNGDYSDLKTFLQTLHSTGISKLRLFFAANVDEDRLMEYQLAQVLLDNLDYAGHNHFLYHEPKTGKWFPLPWDLDLTFGKSGVFDDGEIIPGFSPWFTTAVDGEFQNFLLDRFFSDAGSWYRRAYIIRLYDVLQERFTVEFYDARLSFLKDLLFTEQDEDIRAWGRLTDQGGGQFPRDFLSNLERVRYYVSERRKHLLGYLERKVKFQGHDRLMITELSYNPPSGQENLEFLELWNPGSTAIDLAKWSIDAIHFVFPDGARCEANEVFVVAKDPAALQAHYGQIGKVFGPYEGSLENQGEALRVKDRGPGFPATVDFVRYESGGAWPREAAGFGRTLELTEVSAWRRNDVPESWQASAAEGGSPGVVPGISGSPRRFHRGDSNADGHLDIADVLVTLGYLFLGQGEPACREASDLNASGDIKLDDALFLLRHLFQGAPDPIPFPGPDECGSTTLAACSESNCK